MPKFANNADFQGNQALNMRAEVLASAPSTALARIYFDSTLNALRVNLSGGTWQTLGAPPATTAPAFTFGTTNVAGNSGSLVDANSTIAIFDATAPTTSAVGDAAAVGTAAFAARRDHTHGREGFGAVTAISTFGVSSANGTASTLARSDHNHGSPALPYGTVSAQTTFGAASSSGTSSSLSRADHLHGTPTHLNADHSAINISALGAPTADVSWASFHITNLADPTTAQMAATKNYVDNVAQGLSPKASVRAATTGSETFTITTGNVTQINGTTLDGQTLAIGDRILIKDAPAATGVGSANSSQPGNGIYTVTANTTNLTVARATDMDDANDQPAGAFVFVEAGTSNASTGWVVASPTAGTAFTYGTTAIHWVQFSGSATYSAGTGLSLSGTTFSISATYAGQGSITTVGTIGSGTWQGSPVGVAYGGTGTTTAANARGTGSLGAPGTAPTTGTGVTAATAAGIPTKTVFTIGDGTTTSFTITHNLGTTDVIVSVYAAATPFAEVIPDVQHTSTTTITLIFSTAPTAGQYKVVVIG